MTVAEQKRQIIKEFSDNYSELFVSVFIIKYGDVTNEELYKDLLRCLSETSRKIRKKAKEELSHIVNEEGN